MYTAAAGIDPTRVIALVLDVGTDREELLDYPAYMGTRHERARGAAYDEFVDRYVSAADVAYPEGAAALGGFRRGQRAQDARALSQSICTFNDDMQGTGAMALGRVLAATRVAGCRCADHRVVVFGAGTAGIGIADFICRAMVREGMAPDDARRKLWALGSHGLLVEGMPSGMRDFQRPYARPETEVETWHRDGGSIGLMETVRRVRPTLLIGCAAQPGSFSEDVIREMAAHVERPIIFALSNPTSLSEAVPADLVAWTNGRALVATGSPFPPVTYRETSYRIGQANNALVFPGLGLGTIVAGATTVSDEMLLAAADTVARLVDASVPGAPIMPPVERVREVSLHVALAVATAANTDRLRGLDPSGVESLIRGAMWEPVYRPVRPALPR